ncbi:MAG TPA: three-Cys-motif partner protein TcmP [Phycisphaerae bacterium]
MNDNMSTIWPAEPHTLAKHAILKSYLDRWMPILTRQGAKILGKFSPEILYVDGFAGPGRYKDGEDGSPVLALQAARSHSANFPVPIRFMFIELEDARYECLHQCIRSQKQLMGDKNVRVEDPIKGDCNSVLSGKLDECRAKGSQFGPALIFLDQFGYSAVPMELIAKIMQFPWCEVFSYLEYKHLNRFITDSTKHAGIDAAFGAPEWREAIALPAGKRDQLLLAKYKSAMKTRGNAKFVSHFSMHDEKGQLIYWLFFATNNLRGLEEMKKAMWSVDKTGTFRFSDATDSSQISLFISDKFDNQWLSEELHRKFNGKTLTCAEIKEFVLVDTPCVNYKDALGALWKAGRLRSQIKSGAAPAFDDSLSVEFIEPAQSKLFN